MPTILLVDDMAVIREPIAATLRAGGYTVLTAEHGAEALEILKAARPSLVLLDVAMPVMDGLETLRRMREDPTIPNRPVILLTAVADKDRVLKARDLGVQGYLLKSNFSLKELEARIRHCLSGEPDRASKAPEEPGSTPKTEPAAARSASGAQASAPQPAEEQVNSEEAIKELKPIVVRSEVEELLQNCGELKGLSPTVAEVIKLSKDPKTTTERIAKVIKHDQAIALKILKLANSSAYTRGAPVNTVHDAVVRIGLEAIGQAVLNISVIDQFGEEASGRVDPRLFWEHSIGTGLIAAFIARGLGEKDPDQCFTLGLLHDVGKMVYGDLLEERYAEVVAKSHELSLPTERVESRMLLINHADAMDKILHAWRFPRDLIDPIVFHHLSLGNIRKMAARRMKEVSILALANRLAHALLLGSSGNETLYTTEEFCSSLKIKDGVLDEIAEEIPDQADDVKLSMLSSASGGAWPSRLQHWRGELGGALRTLFVSSAPHADAYRLFFSRLSETSDEPPNLAVVHMTNPRERVPLTTALRKKEEEAGAKGLPAIILSPTANIRLEESAMNERATRMLPSVVTVGRVVGAVKELMGGAEMKQAA